MELVRFWFNAGMLLTGIFSAVVLSNNYSMPATDSFFKEKQSSPVLSAHIKGSVMLGGLFPVHQKGEGDISCGPINADRGVQRVEAMLYTIDQINKNDTILPGIDLGAEIFDTCARGTYALEQSLEYIRASFSSLDASEFFCDDHSKAKPKFKPTSVAGVIGGSYSSVSIQVANLLRLFKIPQISYASTSAQLSDKTRYEYFVRTVPPDRFQAFAMVDIVQYFNWTYVSTIASEGEYGVSGIEYFQQEAMARNICLAARVKIDANADRNEFDEAIDKLNKKHNARVVILFLREEDAKGLLDAATRNNVTGKFIWVAADGWGTQAGPVENNELAAEGALTIILQSSVLPEFDEYFLNLKPKDNKRNPWFREYWEMIHNCKWPSVQHPITDPDVTFCNGDEVLTRSKYRQEAKVQFIYDAVLAMAYSIDEMRKNVCPPRTKICKALEKIDGHTLLKNYILNITFDGE